MKIRSFNEWDPLKSVIVGTASHANFPVRDKLFNLIMSQAGWTKTPPPSGPVAQHIIDETNEDLDTLADTLAEHDVEVYRPDVIDFAQTDGQYAYCPRDNLLVVGNKVIEAPMSVKARQQELSAYSTIKQQAINDGADWIHAPIPELAYDKNVVDGKYVLNESEPVFDAANICRTGGNILYLVSSSGNKVGAKWLQQQIDSCYIHTTDIYNSTHIDSTIVPIGYKHVVLNASRVSDNNLPVYLRNWNRIYITEDMINPQGFEGYPYASKWIAINMLALGNKKVICDKNQPMIIAELEKHSFEVIPLELRHARTLGGGFHCVTLDLYRASPGE